ncbi:hypothetical protein GCM10007391_08540 [Alteromonas halophila]|uniref:Uncharacterized protein n=1 Tax=Alteromonas halophila TaxID=516698 RepID=A0A918MWA8_9ALTE|nr:hypothetical protein GCM10007391_08540 [Alteromonas halophila]
MNIEQKYRIEELSEEDCTEVHGSAMGQISDLIIFSPHFSNICTKPKHPKPKTDT